MALGSTMIKAGNPLWGFRIDGISRTWWKTATTNGKQIFYEEKTQRNEVMFFLINRQEWRRYKWRLFDGKLLGVVEKKILVKVVNVLQGGNRRGKAGF